jgi:hypothetical protein
MNQTLCPSCNQQFDTEKARVSLGMKSTASEIMEMNTGSQGWEGLAQDCATVECPHCKHRFVSDSYRYFGFLTPRGLIRTLKVGTGLLVGLVALMIILDYFDLLQYLP